MAIFKFSEPALYAFGLKVGFRNLAHNHLRLGAKKTFGKISQPVNFYARFPEYHFFNESLGRFLMTRDENDRKVLDIGSPKLFGFYLVCNLPVQLTMTDISTLNIDEYEIMWESVKERAAGSAAFELQDVRSLPYESDSFDAVYSMSVLEHVEGDGEDGAAALEMMRVLKPGGMLVLSVPAGERYQEQLRPLTGQDHKGEAGVGDDFFQRIYTREAFADRITSRLSGSIVDETLSIVVHPPSGILRSYLKLGQTARGFLGAFNPLLSLKFNASSSAESPGIPSEYGIRHSPADIYGDFIYSAIKAGS